MSVLDELRDKIQKAIDRCPPNPSNFERGVHAGLKGAFSCIYDLEAAHPNLTECSITSCAAHKEATP